MVPTIQLLSTAAIALLQFATPGTAQIEGATDADGCPRYSTVFTEGHYNSSGSVRFSLEGLDEWQLSLTLVDLSEDQHDESSDAESPTLGSHISVPESFVGSRVGNDTIVCTYWMRGKNATASDDPADSCRDILSDKCQEALQEIRNLSPGDTNCPLTDPDKIEEACGSRFYFRSTPLNFSSTNCALDDIPGVDIPDDYATFSSLVGGLQQPGENGVGYELYDLRVQQTIPVFMSAIVPGEPASADWKHEKRVFCLAPDDVREGSRVPEEGSMTIENGSEVRRTSVFVTVALSLVVAVLLV